MRRKLWLGWVLLLLFAVVDRTNGSPFPAQTGSAENSQRRVALDRVSASKPLASGIEVRSGKSLIRIEALREDVLRVRAGADGQLGEDASWAVLPAARMQRINVTPENAAKYIGFRTSLLTVQIDRGTSQMRVLDKSGNLLQEDVPSWPLEFHGESYRIYKRMPENEHYYGLGDKVGPLDRRNETFTLWNTDAYKFQESTDPIYKSIPFFIAVGKGYSLGTLLDSTWQSSFDFGRERPDAYSFGAEGGQPDYYLIYGANPKKVVESYAWLTGPPPMPPLWALGYQQSRYSYESEARVREIAGKLRKDKFPADVLYLDIDYQLKNRPFTVNQEAFPHFAGMLADLGKENFHVVAITDLHIAYLPNAGYAPYDTGTAGDHFVKNADGSIFVGEVWPGPAVFPDFTRKGSREWWGTLYKPFMDEGITGFWNDMNEPSVFKVSNKTFPDTAGHRIEEPGFRNRVASHREIHNVYGMQNSRATYEGLLQIHPQQRPFVLTRASYAGGQRYAATWTGDNSATWNHLRMTIPMLLNLGLSGFGMSGADVGGFAGTPGPELLTKWMELAAFQPIDRNHSVKGSGDKEPWVYGADQEAIQRRYVEERYRLMPYIYTATEEMSRTGIPIMRPQFLEFPEAMVETDPLDVRFGNQYLLGRSLLIALPPFPEQPDTYEVKLPHGTWYDYWKGTLLAGSSTDSSANLGSLQIHPTLETLPVYVRGGSILPEQPLVQSTEERPNGPLTLRVYPGENCQGSLYQDDGKSFAFKQGDFLRISFSCEQTADNIKVHIGQPEGKFAGWWKDFELVVYGWNSEHAEILQDGKASSYTAAVDPELHTVKIVVADGKQATEIEFRGKH
jgi:alpha-glucosidase